MCERFVVSQYVEIATLYEVTEMFDSQINRQQLSVESTVSGLLWL